MIQPQGNPHATPVWQPCVPAPVYYPDMPTNPRALPGYLERTQYVRPGDQPSDLNDLGKVINELLSRAYLSSGQRAALYELMAQAPGFEIVPNAVDGIGRRGVGIGWSFDGKPVLKPGVSDVIIFDPRTYSELGITTYGEQGQQGSGTLLKIAIVDKAGQLP